MDEERQRNVWALRGQYFLKALESYQAGSNLVPVGARWVWATQTYHIEAPGWVALIALSYLMGHLMQGIGNKYLRGAETAALGPHGSILALSTLFEMELLLWLTLPIHQSTGWFGYSARVFSREFKLSQV
jgi:hypothetical protein